MAKYYTEQSPTPVFAVTFVSNRKGIVPPEEINNTNKIQNTEEINKLKKEKENLELEKERILRSENSTGAALSNIEKELFRVNNLLDNQTFKSLNFNSTQDNEYLVYSNLEIQKTGPNDLSEQSNWYLRDAEVELTRDWPVCKAKLIVAAKLNDDGSIPNIKQVEKGFVYDQTVLNDDKGQPTSNIKFDIIEGGGRFLSADDEVRIYAGYKNELCVTMNDLDQYPFNFDVLQSSGKIDSNSEDGKRLIQLEKDKKTLEEAISNVGNVFKDPNFYLTAGLTIASAIGIAAFIATTAPVSVPASAVTTAIASTGTVAGGTTVFIAGAGGTAVTTAPFIAGGTAVTTIIPATTTIANGTVIGAATIASGGGAITSEVGSYAINSNDSLKQALQTELNVTNKLIGLIQKKAGVEKKLFTASDKKPLAPIFWGFIDSVDFISNSEAGVQIIYNLRDRSRILADTKLVTLPYLNKDSNERGAFEGLRHKTIEGVYRATNGGIYLDNNFLSATTTQWRDGFDVGEVITLYDNKIDSNSNRILDQIGKVTEIRNTLAEQRIKFSAAIENQAQWVIANSFLSSKDIKQSALSNYDPLFHIWTLQPPVVQGGGQSVMQIVNKSPFEILTYLQVTEVMPIDFFSSHVNGHFLFAPRVLDTTGLNDPERGNRLYFFFQCFDKVPEARSLIKDIRVQTSTIGVYNRFAIANAEFNNPTNASLKDLYTVVDIASANTKNRKVPIKQHIIVDPKIKDQSNAEGYAQGLALTTASIMARDNTTVIFKIIGDSTFYPGEAVRIYNTVLHGKDTFTFNSQTESTPTFLRDLYQEIEKLKSTGGTVKQTGTQNKVVNLNSVIDKIRKGSGTLSDDLNDVLPMYKVRAITHSLKAGGSDAGYTTKIVAIADIL